MLVFNIIIGIIFLVCVLIILVVLIQNPKGGGLSSAFGGGASNLMGVQKTGDLLEKMTWGLAVTLMVLTLGSNFFLDKDGGNATQINSVNVERANETAAPMPSNSATVPAPAAGNEAAPIPGTEPAAAPAEATPATPEQK